MRHTASNSSSCSAACVQHDPSVSLCWVLRVAVSGKREEMNINQLLTALLLNTLIFCRLSPNCLVQLRGPRAAERWGLLLPTHGLAGATLVPWTCWADPANLTCVNHLYWCSDHFEEIMGSQALAVTVRLGRGGGVEGGYGEPGRLCRICKLPGFYRVRSLICSICGFILFWGGKLPPDYFLLKMSTTFFIFTGDEFCCG